MCPLYDGNQTNPWLHPFRGSVRPASAKKRCTLERFSTVARLKAVLGGASIDLESLIQQKLDFFEKKKKTQLGQNVSVLVTMFLKSNSFFLSVFILLILLYSCMAWQPMLHILQRSFIPSSSFASVLAPLATKKRTTSAGETLVFSGQ